MRHFRSFFQKKNFQKIFKFYFVPSRETVIFQSYRAWKAHFGCLESDFKAFHEYVLSIFRKLCASWALDVAPTLDVPVLLVFTSLCNDLSTSLCCLVMNAMEFSSWDILEGLSRTGNCCDEVGICLDDGFGVCSSCTCQMSCWGFFLKSFLPPPPPPPLPPATLFSKEEIGSRKWGGRTLMLKPEKIVIVIIFRPANLLKFKNLKRSRKMIQFVENDAFFFSKRTLGLLYDLMKVSQCQTSHFAGASSWNPSLSTGFLKKKQKNKGKNSKSLKCRKPWAVLNARKTFYFK